MMDCANYRRAVLADPRSADPALMAHRESCAPCAEFSRRLELFETRLARAVRLDVEARSTAPSLPAPQPLRQPATPWPPRNTVAPTAFRRPAWLAIAASLLIAAGAAAGLWLSAPRTSLAGDVVTHMGEEPQAWQRSAVPVLESGLSAVVGASKLRLRPTAGVISYANSCRFRGWWVPHLVMQTDTGPVTIMILVHESVPAAVQFDEQGYRGVILPVAGHGSIAVLTQSANPDLDAVHRTAAQVLQAIVWTG
jgi:hypothetical protein